LQFIVPWISNPCVGTEIDRFSELDCFREEPISVPMSKLTIQQWHAAQIEDDVSFSSHVLHQLAKDEDGP
jgi:hypothetical protein